MMYLIFVLLQTLLAQHKLLQAMQSENEKISGILDERNDQLDELLIDSPGYQSIRNVDNQIKNLFNTFPKGTNSEQLNEEINQNLQDSQKDLETQKLKFENFMKNVKLQMVEHDKIQQKLQSKMKIYVPREPDNNLYFSSKNNKNYYFFKKNDQIVNKTNVDIQQIVKNQSLNLNQTKILNKTMIQNNNQENLKKTINQTEPTVNWMETLNKTGNQTEILNKTINHIENMNKSVNQTQYSNKTLNQVENENKSHIEDLRFLEKSQSQSQNQDKIEKSLEKSEKSQEKSQYFGVFSSQEKPDEELKKTVQLLKEQLISQEKLINEDHKKILELVSQNQALQAKEHFYQELKGEIEQDLKKEQKQQNIKENQDIQQVHKPTSQDKNQELQHDPSQIKEHENISQAIHQESTNFLEFKKEPSDEVNNLSQEKNSQLKLRTQMKPNEELSAIDQHQQEDTHNSIHNEDEIHENQIETPSSNEYEKDLKVEAEVNKNAQLTFSSKSTATVITNPPTKAEPIVFSNSYSRVPKMIKSIDQARINYELDLQKKRADELEKARKEEEERIKNLPIFDPLKNFVEPKVVHSLYYYEQNNPAPIQANTLPYDQKKVYWNEYLAKEAPDIPKVLPPVVAPKPVVPVVPVVEQPKKQEKVNVVVEAPERKSLYSITRTQDVEKGTLVRNSDKVELDKNKAIKT